MNSWQRYLLTASMSSALTLLTVSMLRTSTTLAALQVEPMGVTSTTTLILPGNASCEDWLTNVYDLQSPKRTSTYSVTLIDLQNCAILLAPIDEKAASRYFAPP